VHNDFHQTHGLFPLFDGLMVKDLDKPVEATVVSELAAGDEKAAGSSAPLANGSVAATH
jgi:methylenetetrahydrofolate reductase (NADPH)